MNTFYILFCILYHVMPLSFSEIENEGDRPPGEFSAENTQLNDGNPGDEGDLEDAQGGNADVRRGKKKDPMKNKQYLSEIARGDMADLFSTNIHKNVPPNFPDFGRRFVLQYPYSQKSAAQIDDEAEEHLDKIIRQALKKSGKRNKGDNLSVVKAPPHVVLAVARQSLLAQNTQPLQPEQFVPQKALREGDYWNSVWKEEVSEPKENLRSGNKLKSVRVKIMPGSKLYKIVSMTKELSPKLLYVINDDTATDDN